MTGNTSSAPIPFSVSDVETPAGNLTVTATSANQTLVPNGNLILGGSGTNRALVIMPAPGQSGTALITVNVSDGSASTNTQFALTVVLSTPPIISDVPDQFTSVGTQTPAIPFTIGDAETPATSLFLTASSSNPNLVPNAAVVLGGSGSNRTVTVTPAANLSGVATITLTGTNTGFTSTERKSDTARHLVAGGPQDNLRLRPELRRTVPSVSARRDKTSLRYGHEDSTSISAG